MTVWQAFLSAVSAQTIVLAVAALLAGTLAPAVALAAASISSISPATAHPGDTVRITGNGFGGPNVRVTVGGVAAKVLSATGSTASFVVPAGAPYGKTTVRAANPGGRFGEIDFEVDYGGTATLVTDDAHAVGADIGPAGGTLSSRGLTLTVPAGALLDTVHITLTPISSISGTPFDDSLIGGARFAPDGLRFFGPASLTIPLPAGVAASDVLGFAGDGGGTNLHLTPSVVDAGVITVPISHFSLGGASSGGASAAAAASTHTPITIAQQVKQAIAVLVNQGASQGAGQEGQQIAFFLQLWYNNAVKPGLLAALNLDEPAFEGAAHEWQDWLSLVALYGDLQAGCCPVGPPTVRVQLQTSIDDAQRLALDDAVYLARILLAPCTGFVDFKPPLRDVVRFAAVAEFLGLPIETRTFPDGGAVPAVGELARSCVHLQIEQTTHAPVFAINTANTFTARFGVSFWNGPTRHDLPVDVKLADTTNGPPELIDSATVTSGQWQTKITPSTAGPHSYQFDANLSGISLANVSAGDHFAANVRDRIELQARRAQDSTFADTIGPVQGGGIVSLRVRLAGDGMASGTFTLTNSGAGTLGVSGGVTDQQGEALVSYTAPTSSGSDTITATGGGGSDTLTVTVQAAGPSPVSITSRHVDWQVQDQACLSPSICDVHNHFPQEGIPFGSGGYNFAQANTLPDAHRSSSAATVDATANGSASSSLRAGPGFLHFDATAFFNVSAKINSLDPTKAGDAVADSVGNLLGQVDFTTTSPLHYSCSGSIFESVGLSVMAFFSPGSGLPLICGFANARVIGTPTGTIPPGHYRIDFQFEATAHVVGPDSVNVTRSSSSSVTLDLTTP